MNFHNGCSSPLRSRPPFAVVASLLHPSKQPLVAATPTPTYKQPHQVTTEGRTFSWAGAEHPDSMPCLALNW